MTHPWLQCSIVGSIKFTEGWEAVDLTGSLISDDYTDMASNMLDLSQTVTKV